MARRAEVRRRLDAMSDVVDQLAFDRLLDATRRHYGADQAGFDRLMATLVVHNGPHRIRTTLCESYLALLEAFAPDVALALADGAGLKPK